MLNDEQFFSLFRDRQSRIREPVLEQVKDKQRAVFYRMECAKEFRSLGPHNKDRRRILVYRVPQQNPLYKALQQRLDEGLPLLKIPFLLNSDETVEDRDDILLPIIDELMREAAGR